ncbi:LamG domain-containing protein [Streptomyces caniscabiei]|uniref:LamG-like jellyroll fold domain-containing protein n=1 Tax=Streptomyces caniscabiei TaxID=2746961 RepID=UPI0029A3DD0A|nr:LamG-like jellyroll fold domain-containing protein [Streptomyces caniscabiei]MDX2605831.1 LamG domain-containing protein [Streptomyces caniscabiei]MDX2741199.1 LamG domain-containing protein [Streptomyces caniscabiei]MDX2779728.1 LamG domain-containing protein [Streptomyces caniscabiei]
MTVAAAVLVLAGGLQAAPVRAAGTEQDTGNTGRTADDGARGKDFWEDDELPAATAEARASERAVASGKPVAVDELTSSTSRVVARPDGTFTAETVTSPERVRKDGEWTDIDTTLVAAPDGGLAPRAAEDIRFSGGGTEEPLARMVLAGTEYAVSSPWALPEPEVDGSSAVYRSVLPDVDLAVQAHPDGFTYHLVVHSREAAADPALRKVTFPVETEGLSVRTDDSGAASFVDASGHAVVSSGSALMWDAGTGAAPTANTPAKKASSSAPAAGRESAPASASATVEAVADSLGADATSRTAVMDTAVTDDTLTVVPDQDFLTDTATTYPVVIDPPAVKATLTGWTALWSDSPGTSFWKTKHALGVGYDAFVDNKKSRSLFQFDTRRVAGKKIIDATFTAYAIWSANCDKRDVDLYRTSQISSSTTWNSQERSLKWHAKVDTVSAAKGHSADCKDGDIEFDATAAVAHTAKAKDTLTTLGLRADEGDPIAWKQFMSPLDPEATSARKPRLSITYVTPPDSKPSSVKMSDPKIACSASSAPAQIRDATPRLTATPTSSDASNASLRPNFELYKGTSTTATSLKPTTWTDSGTAGTSVTATLDEKVTYKFRARTEYKYTWKGDTHSLYGPWSGYCYFTVDSKGPLLPKVSSAVYKECAGTSCDAADPEQGSVGMTAGFKVEGGAGDVRRYDWWLNGVKLGSKSFPTNTPTYEIEAAPDKRLTNTLRVQTYDGAGNASPHADYQFRVAKGSDPVASWKFDEGSGTTAADSSGNNRTLTLTSTTWTDKARLGGALRTANVSGQGGVTAGTVLDTTNSFAVGGWVRLTSKDHISTVATQSGTRAGAFQLYFSQSLDRWVFNRYATDADEPVIVRAQSKKPPVVGAWTHVMGVYDHNKKQIRLYVNGQLQAATEFTTPWAAKGTFEVGRMKASGRYSSWFEGDLDHIQVWNRVVFDNEMGAIANAENPATGHTQPALLANWGFDETSGTVAADATGRGHGLTLEQGAAFATTDDPAHGSVLELDAATYARATSPVSLDESGSYTLAGWVDLAAQSRLENTAIAHSPTVFSHPGAERNSFRLWYRQPEGQTVGDWNFGRYETDVLLGPAATVTSDEVNAPGGWVHVVAVFDSVNSSIKLYVSGQRQGDEDGVLSEDTYQPAGPLMVGGSRRHDNGEWGNPLPGRLDDLRVYAGVLSDAEITQLATVDEPPVPIE